MNENTVFNNPSLPKTDPEDVPVVVNNQPVVPTPSATPSATPVGAPVQPVQPSSPPQVTPVQKPAWPQQPLADDDHDESFFSSGIFSLLIKVVVGIVILLVAGFLGFRFLLPLFTGPSNEKVTLVYWGLWEDPQVMQSVINDFQKENPNITVSYQKQDIKEYRERFTTRSQNGNGPDVFRFHNSWVPQLKSLLLPLPNDVITPDAFQKAYYPVAQADLVKNGAIYGIPLEIDTLALFTNKEIFAASGVAVPTTWEEFSSTARSLTVKDEQGAIKTSGAALGTFDNITHASDIVSLLLVQNGTNLIDMNQTTANASDALSYYTSFAKDEGNVWDETLDPSIMLFAKGNLAMYFGYSWDIFAIRAMNPNLVMEIHPVPHLLDRKMSIASYWVEGASTKSKHQKESLLFLKFLARKETEQKLFAQASKTRLFGEPYARKDLAPLLKDNPLVYPFANQGQDAVSTFFVSDTYDNGLNSQMNGYLGNAVRSILGNTSPQTAVETLVQGVTQVLKQYGQ